MHSENFMTKLNTNAAEETGGNCPISQAFDYTYVIDNSISAENNNRRKLFIFFESNNITICALTNTTATVKTNT